LIEQNCKKSKKELF